MADKTHQYPSKTPSRPAGQYPAPGPIGPRPRELDDFISMRPLTFKEKLIMKTKENPFVPIGGALTVVALSMGIFNLYKGDSRKQQLMMRFRIGAQGFTVAALLLGVVYHNSKKR
ncbi:HIG1 domain family member 2A, mitochondrial-like [Amphiura filiformis]|uniref:HIG1 domain family member 2A, mitochondrial-like n=1 Tax=Amphiura filiformis TaxID=82378 RepID=UPI003B2255A5